MDVPLLNINKDNDENKTNNDDDEGGKIDKLRMWWKRQKKQHRVKFFVLGIVYHVLKLIWALMLTYYINEYISRLQSIDTRLNDVESRVVYLNNQLNHALQVGAKASDVSNFALSNARTAYDATMNTTSRLDVINGKVNNASDKLDALGKLSDTQVIHVFGKDEKYRDPHGLQNAYNELMLYVILRPITIQIADGIHYLPDALVLEPFAYSNMITIQGNITNSSLCVLVAPHSVRHNFISLRGREIRLVGFTIRGSRRSYEQGKKITGLIVSSMVATIHGITIETFRTSLYSYGNNRLSIIDCVFREFRHVAISAASSYLITHGSTVNDTDTITRNVNLNANKPCISSSYTSFVRWKNIDGNTINCQFKVASCHEGSIFHGPTHDCFCSGFSVSTEYTSC